MSIRIAIIGCGHIAKRHAEHINPSLRLKLIACHNIHPKRGNSFADQFNVSHDVSLEQLLAQDNLVSWLV